MYNIVSRLSEKDARDWKTAAYFVRNVHFPYIARTYKDSRNSIAENIFKINKN